jgi:hypothetical protein
MNQLELKKRDRLVSAAKGLTGVLPFVGTMVCELLDTVIPDLRFERVVSYLKIVGEEVGDLSVRLESFEKSIKTEEGIDIFEEGIIQASRAVSHDRKSRLARLIAKSLSAEKLKYEESRKILNIYTELTDPEIVWLIYYSLNPAMGNGPDADYREKHPDILMPARLCLSSTQNEIDHAAIQESYKSTLRRLGLITNESSLTRLTSLGHLLISYIKSES